MIVLVYLGFIYEPDVIKPIIGANATATNTSQEIEILPEYITYIYNELGIYNLHPPLLSSDTPKIGTNVEGELFFSEVIKNNIITEKRGFDDVDLIFITTKQAVIDSINSNDVGESFKGTLNSGETTFEIVAGESTLFLKGYLELYQELTGEEYSLAYQVRSTLK